MFGPHTSPLMRCDVCLWSSVEIQTPTRWNMIGSSVAASFVAQQYSSATILLRFPANNKKIGAFPKYCVLIFFNFLKYC
jgi:hypothetical protein